MKTVELFGNIYHESNLPKEITLKCGCNYIRNKDIIGVSYSLAIPCSQHEIIEDLDDQKNIKIKEIKEKIKEEILDIYPYYKQLNIRGQIRGYNKNDLEKMNKYIEFIASQMDIVEQNILNKTNLKDVLDYKYEK